MTSPLRRPNGPGPGELQTIVCTIVSKNYLAYARTLMRSVSAQHPGWQPWVLLVDRVDGYFDPAQEPFRLVTIEELPIPERAAMLFRYGVVEMNTAAKPWLIEWLFREKGAARVVYLDPDIYVYSPLTDVEDRLDGGSLAVLTPHLTGRVLDGHWPGERDILVSGTYNLGFIALSRQRDLEPLLEFWRQKSRSEFEIDIRNGLFTDQKWIDLVPGLFADVGILRDEGHNVAYWNLAQRRVERADGGYRVNGVRLVYFHFSGLDPLHPESLSRYQDRFRLSQLGAVRDLVEEYCRAVVAHGHERCRAWPYAFGRFHDGVPVTDLLRSVYRRSARARSELGEDPFAAGAATFSRRWNPSDDRLPTLTLLMKTLWDDRPDLQRAFPDPVRRDRKRFAEWFVDKGQSELGLPAEAVATSRYELERLLSSPHGAPQPDEEDPSVAALDRLDLDAVPTRPGADPAPLPDAPASPPTHYLNQIWAPPDLLRPPVTRIMKAVYERRADIRAAFPDILVADRWRFARWFLEHAGQEHRLPAACLAPIADFFASLDRTSSASRATSAPGGQSLSRSAFGALFGRPNRRSRAAAPGTTGLALAADPDIVEHPLNASWSASDASAPPVTMLMKAIHSSDSALRERFPDLAGADRWAFAEWFVARAVVDYRIPPQLVTPVRRWFASYEASVRAPTPAIGLPNAAPGSALGAGATDFPAAAAPFARAAPPTTAPGRARLRVVTDYDGFFDLDEDVIERGSAWMGPRARVRLRGLDSARAIEVALDFEPLWHSRANGRGELELTLLLDSVELGSFVIGSKGAQRISVQVPPGARTDGALHLIANQFFLPADVGGSPVDIRQLAVRLASVAVDRDPILDFSRPVEPYRPFGAENRLPSVDIVGYFGNCSGVGESARLFAAACDAAGIPTSATDLSSRRAASASPGRDSIHVLHVNADQTPHVCQLLGNETLGDGYRIGVWHWELPEFPDAWLSSFSFVDEIWAPSQFVARALAEKSPVPVLIMPHGVRVTPSRRPSRSALGLPEREFIFLTTVDLRSFTHRKNPESSIAAFSRAFPNASGAKLVLKVSNGSERPEEYRRIQELASRTPGVLLVQDLLSRAEMSSLEALCDGFVSLHRSEGFGLALAECMSLGKPVVGTNWSGNVDFMNHRNSCPVDYELVSLEQDYGPYRRGSRWAEPDVDHAASLMRRLVNDAPWRERLAAEGRATIEREFSPEAAGERYRRRLRRIVSS